MTNIASQTWRDSAKCADLAMSDKAVLDVFYPEPGSDRSPNHMATLHRRAKRICAQCPVRRECLETALSDEEGRWDPDRGRWSRHLPAGVWGGHTDRERHHRNIRHLPECRLPTCRACRPLSERAALLEELFVRRAHKMGLLTSKERIV